MNKEITKLLRADEGTLRIWNGVSLRRWTKNGLGDEVDGLRVEVTLPTGRVVYRNIVSRLPSFVAVEMSEAVESIAKSIRNVYRG